MLRVPIMLTRIEEQMASLKPFQSAGTMTVSAEPIEGITVSSAQTLEQQIQGVARRVEETILAGVAQRPPASEKTAVATMP